MLKGNNDISMKDRKVRKIHLLGGSVDGEMELGVEYDGNVLIKMEKEKVKELYLREYVELLEKYI